MLINLNKKKILFLKNILKKKYYFYGLVCLKSRIKFKTKHNIILIKINNNISIIKKKKETVNIKIVENKIFLFSENLRELNEFTKTLYKYCAIISFL